ncbi:cytochrome b/b6 domain-containing protein [Paracoccus sp. SSJ]|uniref:cytochrome b/b6 domain-containing protein n=1 Tax=Paracoccus sp. SSJ TaxID=3050636 RepID=UPI002551088F|nr:cytochrome b/b6 domain-containing protein [Paracoccus sp. SSJ]MDK8871426.1 cytochrome b/b6 domain-containing protein [Paracoccus sp. SSJ]
MKASNTARAYGWVARFFHWTVAVLILAAIAVGLYADNLPEGGESQLQAIFAAYSLHKTVGMAALALVALRILWTLTQPKPRPLHPGRRLETLGAELVHWALWIGMIVMPLSGWLLHSAAPGGFARILWPFGQRLPFVPEDLALSERFAAFHEFGWWLLAGLIALHVLGALKHAIIDRDGTMSRMAGDPGRAPEPPAARPGVLPHVLAAMAALAIWVGIAFIPAGFPDMQEPAAAASVPASTPATVPEAGWAVEQGTLEIEVTQAGSAVAGQFGQWQADIAYDPESRTGRVAVSVDIASLTLGAVSDAAKGPDFLNAAAHPVATFEAEILPPPAEDQPHVAHGRLTIAGQTIETDLPFALTVQDDVAQAQGRMRVDRRDFGIGAGYADEGTVGFGVEIGFALSAKRQ